MVYMHKIYIMVLANVSDPSQIHLTCKRVYVIASLVFIDLYITWSSVLTITQLSIFSLIFTIIGIIYVTI